MSQPPELLSFYGDWAVYEDLIYEVFLDSSADQTGDQ